MLSNVWHRLLSHVACQYACHHLLICEVCHRGQAANPFGGGGAQANPFGGAPAGGVKRASKSMKVPSKGADQANPFGGSAGAANPFGASAPPPKKAAPKSTAQAFNPFG